VLTLCEKREKMLKVLSRKGERKREKKVSKGKLR
jgi:hypothetical protein